MSSEHDVNAQTSIDMAGARRNSSVDIYLIRDFLHNGRAEWEKRKKILDTLGNDPVFDKSQRDFLSRTERYTRGLAITNRIYELQNIHNWSQQEASIAINGIDESLPIGLHNVAFQPVVLSQGSPELIKEFGPLITNRGILGCYLQTELGHGTNVSRLETTATYIPESKEFEIHSPTLTSSKWWIGALGKTATHGVVQAKLILGGKDYGPHLFLIQLRSMDNHKVLPGIIIGDIGPKSLGGFAATDNGFARFDHVRIPKTQMLSKFAQVADDNTYVRPPHAKLSYGGMLYIRANMVTGAGWLMAKAATISIRYTTVRRQGEIGPDGLERQAISYPSVYSRLLPILSHAYVFIHLGKTTIQSFELMSSRLQNGDASLLAEMHAITSGLKVLVSTSGVQDVEVARRSMGGHGYSAFSGLGRLYADYLPSATYEGDNFVLDQQVVRAALKSYVALLKSKDTTSLSPSTSYLRLLAPSGNAPLTPSDGAWQDPTTAILLLEWRAAFLVRELAQVVQDPDASSSQRVAKAVTEAFVGARVGDIIKGLPETFEGKESDVKVIGKLYLLYLLTTLEAGIVDLLSFGALGGSNGRDATRSLRLAIKNLCIELLPEAIGLSDAFGFTDWELDSALGVYDGKVYEQLWKRAQTEPLNKTEIPVAYEQSIKPMLERGQRQAAAMRTKL
ncbi:peroxisomal oxidase [Macrolepiota fuliginosa MF-IS2]|uniref:Acyl-coenzyme A oxidase n=1 Tax=Macrolepiota fuliginosa MF-IS2 TaxID=1400762 RepID=A0A9P5XHK4_9AGAR|nr:peroxisomal oxidase [Macrolepiota fuliginosa MF-IS2]